MKKLIPVLILIPLFIFLGCTEDELVELIPADAADSVAAYWFMALSDTLMDIEAACRDLEEPDEYIRTLDFSIFRAGFTSVTAVEATHGLANLGHSSLDFIELVYSSDLWDFIDDIKAIENDDPPRLGHPLRRGLQGRHLQILAETPLFMVNQVREIPPDLTVPRTQLLVRNTIMPALTAAIGHVDLALDDTGFSQTFVIGEETHEVDLGEVYCFKAMLLGLRSSMRMMVSYNFDIAGPDGTYDWLETDHHTSEATVVPGTAEDPDTLDIHVTELDGGIDAARMFLHQLTPGSEFMTLWEDPYSGATELGLAHDDLLAMLTTMEAGIASIQGEGDDQDDDIIMIGDLEDLNAEIDPGEGDPDFMQDWTTINDVIDWIEDILQNEYNLVETIDGVPIDVVINLSAFFNTPVADFKTLLPYHETRPEEEWIETTEEEPNMWARNPDYPYEFWDGDEVISYENIGYVRRYFERTEMSDLPVNFLDAPEGSVINVGEVLPYFPDYTLGGIYPDMTRELWETIWSNFNSEGR
ncbi:MAG: hypothetical protein GY835_26385 [bacterium]|nr:hypothetical protein [bacterium]